LRNLKARARTSLWDERAILDLFLPGLEKDLQRLVIRTLVLELNIARLQGELEGTTSRERFSSFIGGLQRLSASLAVLQSYPVLARLLVTRIQQWRDSTEEFFSRFLNDEPAIAAEFSIVADARRILSIDTSVGDRHRDGRSVVIIAFDSGGRLVYKPRSLRTDMHFQSYLAWLNAKGVRPAFRRVKVLDRGDYGWMEFVEAAPCQSTQEVERFYYRQGGYLASLYLLGGTDIHHENLIAAGESPVVIDLETLFKPQMHPPGDEADADRIAVHLLHESVLGTGLLPHRASPADPWYELDVSGLGFQEGQNSPFGVPSLDRVGTDEMRILRRTIPIRGGQSQPKIGTSTCQVEDYLEAVLAGFRDVFAVLLQNCSELLSDEGPLAGFREVETRVVLRSTRTYSLLLSESLHPSLLADGLRRDCFLDHLWAHVPQRPYLERVLWDEQEDLLRGDVPIFTCKPASTDLQTAQGRAIDGFFDVSGWHAVRARAARLNQDDAERQLWLIRTALADRSRFTDTPRRRFSTPSEEIPRGTPDAERLLNAAQWVGQRLSSLAIHGARDVSWLALGHAGGGRWLTVPLGMDLYEGVPGVLLFLAHVAALTRDDAYASLAEKAMATFLRQIDAGQSKVRTIGAFNGWGGTLYVLAHLAALWGRAEFKQKIVEITSLLEPLIRQDDNLDVISGSAGCILALAAVHRVVPSRQILESAELCGQKLEQKALKIGSGKAWMGGIAASAPLTGFSHGAAGIAYALCRLSQMTEQTRFVDLACEAIRYERSVYSPQEGNWPDLRSAEADASHLWTTRSPGRAFWCHGASGIALSRLGMLGQCQGLEGLEARREIETGCQTTVRMGFGRNLSLCHGDLGNLELLLTARRKLELAAWDEFISEALQSILTEIEAGTWRCGHPKGVESVGLMTGLAGIGLGLLRTAFPGRVPSVLLLEPPGGAEADNR
jgi:type 2 lantibiotic biosynthesis protein LanM